MKEIITKSKLNVGDKVYGLYKRDFASSSIIERPRIVTEINIRIIFNNNYTISYFAEGEDGVMRNTIEESYIDTNTWDKNSIVWFSSKYRLNKFAKYLEKKKQE